MIVQKYGGSSVSTASKIQEVAKKIIARKHEDAKKNTKEKSKIVIVLSAMADTTDKLIKLANELNTTEEKTEEKLSKELKREYDALLATGEMQSVALLSIALNSLGCKAISLNAFQSEIRTSNSHNKARINSINTNNISRYLNEGFVVIITGFQGFFEEEGGIKHLSTLGRGGSDLSAVALAGALKATQCEIYSDVEGVYSTDPRIIPKARKVELITYDEMIELSSLGAKVLQERSVGLAKKLGVDIILRSASNNGNGGTLISSEEKIKELREDMEQPIITGIALDKDQARASIVGVIDKPGIAARIFNALAKAEINVDMIVQTIGRDGKTDIDFTFPKNDLEMVKKVFENLPYEDIEFDKDIAKVSIVGLGMKTHSGIASKTFSALASNNINIMMISTSEIKISIVIKENCAKEALKALHSIHGLDDES